MRGRVTLTLLMVLALEALPLPWVVMASDAQFIMWLVTQREAPALP